jgi:hypothetical protein
MQASTEDRGWGLSSSRSKKQWADEMHKLAELLLRGRWRASAQGFNVWR